MCAASTSTGVWRRQAERPMTATTTLRPPGKGLRHVFARSPSPAMVGAQHAPWEPGTPGTALCHEAVMSIRRAVRRHVLSAPILLAALAFAPAARAQDSASGFWSLPWTKGPTTGRLHDLAEIQVPEGYVFMGKDGTRRFMERTQNPTNGDEYGTLAPIAADENWFVVFEFDNVGYVKDDEKDKIDADALLKSMQEGSKRANKERKRRGWAEMDIVGWSSPPSH